MDSGSIPLCNVIISITDRNTDTSSMLTVVTP